MTEEHQRFQELAVGHVLGGLDAADAASFRAHLLGCRDCRRHVAELRGIADELAAAERDEREHDRLRTEVLRRSEVLPDEPPPTSDEPRRGGTWHVAVIAVLVVLFAAGMAFWNLHLRTAASLHADIAEQRGGTLLELASGLPVEAEFADGLDGMVVVDGNGVAFSIAGIAPPLEDQRVVAWLLGTDRGRPVVGVFAQAGQLEDGVFAAHLADHGASELMITLESGPPEQDPSGRELVRVDLRPSTAGD